MPLSKRQALCARPTGAEAVLYQAARHQPAFWRRAGKAERAAEMDKRFVMPAEFGKEDATRRFDVRVAVDRGQRGEACSGAIGPADRNGTRQFDDR